MSKPPAFLAVGTPGQILHRVLAVRNWPAVPYPTGELESLHLTVLALEERSHVQSRESGDVQASFVTVDDLITLRIIDVDGKQQMLNRIIDLEERVTALEVFHP